MKTIETNKNVQQEKTLSDATLFRRLDIYQRIRLLCTFLALGGTLCAIPIALFMQKKLLAAAFFAAVAAAILLGSSLKKKRRTLIQERMHSIFQAEVEKAFGEKPQTPLLPITDTWLRDAQPIDLPWETCKIHDFQEGFYRGVRFSAANVVLEHVHSSHHIQEGRQTYTEKQFGGIVIRCKTAKEAPARIFVHGRPEEKEEQKEQDCASGATNDGRYSAVSVSQDAIQTFLTPQCIEALRSLEEGFRGVLAGLLWDGDGLTVAVNTQYVFANVPDSLDARSVDALRSWCTASLQTMCRALDTLIDNFVCFYADTEK